MATMNVRFSNDDYETIWLELKLWYGNDHKDVQVSCEIFASQQLKTFGLREVLVLY
jgi:hypothetical protein